tara:strand:+ start:608 stop:784 length:177 start_codon:yes stop_codon:yes gene_type:complete
VVVEQMTEQVLVEVPVAPEVVEKVGKELELQEQPILVGAVVAVVEQVVGMQVEQVGQV